MKTTKQVCVFTFTLCLVVTVTAGSSAAQRWQRLLPSGTPPDQRTDSSAIYDAGSNTMITFGGTDKGCTFDPSLNDTWILASADGLGSALPRWTHVFPGGTLPAGRRGHTAIFDASTDRMVIFGGDPVGCSVPKYSDVWVLIGATLTHGSSRWVQLAPAGGPPPGRSDHAAAYDPVNNRMIIAGGYGEGSNYNDVWVLTNANGLGGTPTWVQLSPTGQGPSATGYRGMVYDAASNRLTVFGGWNCCSSPYFNDTNVLTNANGLGGSPTWITLSPSGTLPSPRFGSKAVYDPPTNTMTMFGGQDSSGQLNQVWSLTSANGLNGTPAWS